MRLIWQTSSKITQYLTEFYKEIHNVLISYLVANFKAAVTIQWIQLRFVKWQMKVKNKLPHFVLPTNTAAMKMQEKYSVYNHKLATGVIFHIYLHWFAVQHPVFCN